MTGLTPHPDTGYFDAVTGLLSRAAFHCGKIYREEQSEIFGRCWLFVAPEAWLRADGAYVTTTMGEVPVVLWRTPAGALRAFINGCPGGHGALAPMRRGIVDRLTCTCHGWRYDDEGRVEGMAHVKLTSVPQVTAWRGLIFATLDANAMRLASYIGDFAWL